MSMQASSEAASRALFNACASVPFLATLVHNILDSAGLYVVLTDKEST